jgi:AcrR family transcriptional regulator
MRKSKSALRPQAAGEPSAEPWSFALADLLTAQATDPAAPKGQRTLLRLKAGAATTLSEMPYQTMRVADIVKAAGVSHGLFYHYFKDKESITLAIVEEMIRISDERYGEIHAADDPFQSIYVPNLYFLNIYRKNAGLMRAALTLSDEVEAFRHAWNDATDRWHKRIARAIRTHTAASNTLQAEADLLAYCLGAMIDQICRQLFVQQNPHLRARVTSIRHLAEVLSIAWYRATHGRDPAIKQVETCRSLVLRSAEP